MGLRASAVFRSLSYYDAKHTGTAVAIEEDLLKAAPGEAATLARIGDIFADRERFDRATPYWNRIPELKAGDPEGYLQAATIFWDYYLFDDSLRLIRQAREKFGRPALYGYEAGAVYEGQRKFPEAVREYARNALTSAESSPAKNRLLALARRPALREMVDNATAVPGDGAYPEATAVRLRLDVLEAQDRNPEVKDLLLQLVERASSLEALEFLETTGEQKRLDRVKQRSLERQAALTSDPVRKRELHLALVRFFESQRDSTSAQRELEALYAENPKILGVVRAAVDFYWRHKLQPRAVAVLRESASRAYPELRTRFNFEAARKATALQDFAQARELLTPLLKESPYNGEYLAAMGD
ncbi:MAG: tetratricopeptide repeat protein, partial [Terriglobales bacterium]